MHPTVVCVRYMTDVEGAAMDSKIARIIKETWIFFVNVNTYNCGHKWSRKITSRRQNIGSS